MKSPTDEEIKAVIDLSDSAYRDPKVEITRSSGLVQIHAEQMYEYLPLTFKTLSALSELFGTKNIDEISRGAESGCESCDWGSCYAWTLEVKDE